MVYEISIRRTGKAVGAKGFGGEGWNMFDSETKVMRSKREALAFIRERYAKRRRMKTYVDTPRGQRHVGYVYKLGMQRDWSHSSGEKWYQQDWVDLRRVKKKSILF